MKSNIIKLAENYACSLLTEKSPNQNVYHNLNHTKEVVAAVVEISNGEKISEEELEIVTIAAWFHDLGYIEKTTGHEEISAMFASGFLADLNFNSGKIDEVVGCILATRVPQEPKEHIQQIICDADLSHFGRDWFIQRNNLFRTESEFYKKKKLSNAEFIRTTIEFMRYHQYFTEYAIKHFGPNKEKNILLLQDQLNTLNN